MRKPFDGDYPLTQGFGLNPADYAKFNLRGHDGLDYGLPSHTEVRAPHSGKVIEAASDPNGYGNYLKIENDVEGSVLAHLLSFNVVVGANVNEGDLIGFSDNTGNSTGPHLHWGYYRFPRDRSNGFAGFIDQTQYIQDIAQSAPPAPLPVLASPLSDDEARALHVLKTFVLTSTDSNNNPFGNLEGYANTLCQDAYRAWKNPRVTPAPPIVTTVYKDNEPVFTSSLARQLYQWAKQLG